MIRRVLLVEPDAEIRECLQDAIPGTALVRAVEDFAGARELLISDTPDLLIANVRLAAYNGVHLALLADQARTKCVIYVDSHDMYLARQVQAAGAFYARMADLRFALRSFVRAQALPPRDLRTPAERDRRSAFRGGRRSTDVIGLRLGDADFQ